MIKDLGAIVWENNIKFFGDVYECTIYPDMSYDLKEKEQLIVKITGLFYPILIILDIINFFIIKNSQNIWIGMFLIISIFCYQLIKGKSIKLKPYYGAIYKVYNCYINKKDLTLENAKSESRLSINNNFINSVFVYFSIMVLYYFSHILVLSYILGGIIGGILFTLNVKKQVIPIVILTTPITMIGLILQSLLITKEPSEKELNMALTCITKLIEKEEELS